MPAHLTPIEPAAADVILTGDPRRAFALAQALMIQPRMSHQARGLWGYTGTTEAGLDLTVQSTGSGGPSAVAVIADLHSQGAKRLVRLGSCLAGPGATPGGRFLVEAAFSRDGTSRSLLTGTGLTTAGDDPDPVEPDPGLTAVLAGLAPTAVVSSHDLVARIGPEGPGPARGASLRDLQTAATLAYGRRASLATAAALIVAEVEGGARLTEAELNEPFTDLGRAVLTRLEKRIPNP